MKKSLNFQIDAQTGKSISFKDLLAISCSLAAALRKNGFSKNTIISICSENSIHFFIPIIAALYIGAITAPVNHVYTKAELKHNLDLCQPEIVFCSKAASQKFVALNENGSYKIVVIDMDEKIHGTESLTDFISRSLNSTISYTVQIEDVDPDDQVGFILSSSGTTGLPKGVMLTHTNILVRYVHTL